MGLGARRVSPIVFSGLMVPRNFLTLPQTLPQPQLAYAGGRSPPCSLSVHSSR